MSVALGFPMSEASGAPDRPTENRFERWLDERGAYFELHPELKKTKGSGWKPYNRAKWFYEQRLVDGVPPSSLARWVVWEKVFDDVGHGGGSAATWFSLGPTNYAGRVLDIEFHPGDTNIVYVGSASGGLWRSTDQGGTWAPLTDDLPSLAIGAVAVLPSNPNIVLIGTGEGANGDVYGVGILKSTDAGFSWAQTDFVRPVEGFHGFHVMEVNPLTGTILAGATDGLWRSTDDGETWLQARVGGDYYDVKWKPGDANRAYTVKGSDASGNNVKVSTDDGVTWTRVGTGQPASLVIGKSKLAVSAADPSTVYALYSDNPGNMTGLYRSTDDGATWAARNTTLNIPGGQGWYNLSLAADPDNVDRVIAGGVDFFLSTDGGVNFSGIGPNVHVDHHAITYEPGSTSRLWAGTDGGVWRSSNDGSSWTDRNAGLVTYQFYDICVNNGPTSYFVMGGTQDNGTDKWSGTTTWSEGLGGDGMVCNINPVNGTAVYAEIQFGEHYKNSNSGAGGWTWINSGFTGTKAWVTPVDEDQLVGNHLYTASSAGIFRTTNGGGSWENVASHTATWIDLSPIDGNRVWTAGATVRYTTDDGANWTQAAPFGFSSGSVTKILAHPTDVNAAFVTFSGYGAGLAHVAMTTDLGASWVDVSGDFPSQPVNAIAVDPLIPTHWFIGTDIAVWMSDDGGTSWTPFANNLPNAVVADLEIQVSQRKLVAGTYGRGAWEIDITPPLRAAPEAGPVATRPAANLMLDPPAPNPVSERTILRYAAKHVGAVTLDIYDVRGRRVHSLAQHSDGDGIIRTTPWFPDDVPSGVYFAVLQAGSARKTQKLIVTR
jgi:hypothetical protein